MRRALGRTSLGTKTQTDTGQEVLAGTVVLPKNQSLFEYAVLVTPLPEKDLLTIAQQ